MSVKIGDQSCSNSHQVIVLPKIDFSTQSTRKVTFQFQNYSEPKGYFLPYKNISDSFTLCRVGITDQA